MVRDLHAQLTALLDRPASRALPALDARPKPPVHADAPAVVAGPRATAKCPICQTRYDLGEPVGELFVYYPKGEYRYWGHCLTARHQWVLAATTKIIHDQLNRLPEAMSNAKLTKREARDPARLALSQLLQ
jgi:hypothetical protein